MIKINITQAKDILISQGEDPQTIDWASYSKDIELQDWLNNEYGIKLQSETAMFNAAKCEQEKFSIIQEKKEIENQKLKGNIDFAALFSSPKIIGIVADANEGKSNLIYFLFDELGKNHNFNAYTYGLRNRIPNTQPIFSIEELEQTKNSIVVIDEFDSLFDLDNRKEKQRIERSIRLIFHNNNVLVLSGLSENFKKFISAKLHCIFFKKTTISDLINGSRVKEICCNYRGIEMGSSMLDLSLDESLLYDGLHYKKFDVPYFEGFDTKRNNANILMSKNVSEIVENKN